jgi:demethylmenaquinone methyltransferase/2-methoxy-6-polyprenyl-1,4-benzoquinol methylase
MPAEQGAGSPDEPGGESGRPAGGRAASPPGIGDPGSGTLEAGQVRAMFDRIAGIYDLMNSAMTAGLHHRWRARAADLARVGPGDRVLDVATGTGDLALELARRVAPGGEVIGSDFAEGMLARARAKAQGATGQGVRLQFEWGDALELAYEDNSFAAATVGFGARNFSDLSRGLAEMTRVVRPGGRVVVLEITTPVRPPLSLFYRVWFDRIVPALGLAAGGVSAVSSRLMRREADPTIAAAYTYLPNSVKRFPSPRALAAEMSEVGLADVSYLLTAGGIVAIHAGTVPAERTP